MKGDLGAAVGRLAPSFPPFEPGQVWLAGAGPGSLGCLTLEVIAALSQADAVVYDALVDPAALRAAEGAELRFVGKRRGQPSTPQEAINTMMITLARRGDRVLPVGQHTRHRVFEAFGQRYLVCCQVGVA